MDFRSGESFDDHHRPTTLGTRPKIARTGGGGLLLGLRCGTEQLEAKWQGGGTFAVGQEAEVTDAHKTFGEQMQQEAAQELIDRKRQQFLFVVVGRIAPTKRDLPISKGDQSMVGDGHAMGVTAQITEHMLWASERAFRVDHPVLSEQWSQPRSKGFWLSEELQVSMKVELAVMKGALEGFVELAAEYAAEHLDGKKKVVMWFDPARVIGRQSTGWHHAMDMRMKFDFLTPSM